MRTLIVSALAALSLALPSVAQAQTPSTVPWNQCRGIQWTATLLGRPPLATTHRCSASIAENQQLTRAGDAEVYATDFFSAAHADLIAALAADGTVHSIGDVRTTYIGPSDNGSEWRATVHFYERDGLFNGDQCVASYNLKAITFDGEPSVQATELGDPVCGSY